MDNPHPPLAMGSAIDYEVWLRSGRQIDGIEVILQKFLRTRDSRIDLAQVAYVLGWLGSSQSVPALINALYLNNSRVRTEAAASLGRLGDIKAVEPLCQRLIHDNDHNVRANAAVALGMIGDLKSEPCLRSALNDENEFVTRLTREALDHLHKKHD
ncbi:HEAT repeat domain-containing protein [Candidatus Acetothermia bacterium]|nr:HEAT repeat domain-containing protein [Candidatus Acetothermia bacterium]